MPAKNSLSVKSFPSPRFLEIFFYREHVFSTYFRSTLEQTKKPELFFIVSTERFSFPLFYAS